MTVTTGPRRPHAAERERERYWARKTGRHVPFYIPIEPVIAHVRILRQAGLTISAIAGAAGISQSALRSALTHGNTKIGRPLAQQILAVRARLDEFPADAFIPADGTRRRLQALACLGWTGTQLAKESGVPVSALVKLRGGEVITARAGQARAVYEMYRRLSGTAAQAELAVVA